MTKTERMRALRVCSVHRGETSTYSEEGHRDVTLEGVSDLRLPFRDESILGHGVMLCEWKRSP